MEIKEKIKNYYAGMGIKVDNDYIENILKDENRTKEIIRIYKKEEMEQINIMFQKEIGNAVFTREELEFANQFDLFDQHIGKVAGIIWKYRNNKKALQQIKDIMNANEIDDFDGVLGGAN